MIFKNASKETYLSLSFNKNRLDCKFSILKIYNLVENKIEYPNFLVFATNF